MTYQGDQDPSSWLSQLFGPRPMPRTPEAQQREWAIVQHALAPQNRGGGTLGGIGNAAASIAGALAGRSALDRINQGQMAGLGGAAANIPALGDFDTTPPAMAPPPAVRNPTAMPPQQPAATPGTATPAAGVQGGAGMNPFLSSSPSSAAVSHPALAGHPDLVPAVEFIKKKEGFTPIAKWDYGQYSGGYGTEAKPGQQFTPESAENDLINKVKPIEDFIFNKVKVPLTATQRAALISFGYNLGTGDGGLSDIIPDINSGNIDRAARRMLSYDHAGGRELKGLTQRRAEEAAMLLGRAPEAQTVLGPDGAGPTERDQWARKWMKGTPDAATFGGGPSSTPIPGVTLREPPVAMTEGARPEAIEAAANEARQGPRPPMPPMPSMPSPQNAMISAIGGQPAASQAPARVAQATPQQSAAVTGDYMPPTPGMPKLPSDKQIQALWGSGQPGAKEFAEKLWEFKLKALAPQMMTNPYTGDIYIGNQYSGFHKSPMPGLPQIEKDPLKVGNIETVRRGTWSRGPDGRPYLVPIQQAGSAAPTAGPAAAGGAESAGQVSPESGMPPIPGTIEGMADWSNELNARRKSAEVTASKSSEAIFKPVAEAIDTGSKARSVIESLDIMADAYQAGGKNISGGPLGEYVLNAKGAISQIFGMDQKGLTESNIIHKTATQMAGKLTRELSARPALVEFTTYLKNTPGIMMNNQAALYMISILRQQEAAKEELGKLAMDIGSKNPRQWNEIKQKYYDEHPIISPFTKKPITNSAQAIEEVKSAAARKPAQPAPQSAAPGTEGNPIPVKSLAEAKKLDRGTFITLPDGTPGRVP